MPEATLILLFAAATAVAVGARLIKIPYTVALVLAGLALGATRFVQGTHLTKELLYSVFLPGLVFDAAYHMEFRAFRRDASAILALSIPGVVAATGATAALLVTTAAVVPFARDFGWPGALVFGALIAATDPIAVVALVKGLGAPPRLALLIEGESLVNDGTSIVLFGIVYAAVSGGHLDIAGAALEFVKVVGAGAVIGAVGGGLASWVFRRVDDTMIELTATVIAAYGSFVTAEQLHFSGVIATLTAGMVCGSVGAPGGMGPSTRVAVDSFWQYVAFALNSLVFLLIGLEVPVGRLVAAWKPIAVAFLAVTLARALVVLAATALLRPTRERIPWRWAAILTWGGLRGALSMVLALALPASFPGRELIVTVTFGVVLSSILIQGVTAGPLLRRLNLAAPGGERAVCDRVELRAARAALAALDELERSQAVEAEVSQEMREEYETRVRRLEARSDAGHPTSWREERRRCLRRLLDVEKVAIADAHQEGLLDASERDFLWAEVDARRPRGPTPEA